MSSMDRSRGWKPYARNTAVSNAMIERVANEWLSNYTTAFLKDFEGEGEVLAKQRQWRKWLNRRSQRRGMLWERFARVLQRYPLPVVRVVRLSAVS